MRNHFLKVDSYAFLVVDPCIFEIKELWENSIIFGKLKVTECNITTSNVYLVRTYSLRRPSLIPANEKTLVCARACACVYIDDIG